MKTYELLFGRDYFTGNFNLVFCRFWPKANPNQTQIFTNPNLSRTQTLTQTFILTLKKANEKYADE